MEVIKMKQWNKLAIPLLLLGLLLFTAVVSLADSSEQMDTCGNRSGPCEANIPASGPSSEEVPFGNRDSKADTVPADLSAPHTWKNNLGDVFHASSGTSTVDIPDDVMYMGYYTGDTPLGSEGAVIKLSEKNEGLGESNDSSDEVIVLDEVFEGAP
jgi:hypothetical protein